MVNVSVMPVLAASECQLLHVLPFSYAAYFMIFARHFADSMILLQACSEGSLFGACMIWVEESDSKIDEVEQLLPLIRFPLMTQQELQVHQSSCPVTNHLSCNLQSAKPF